MRPRFPVLIGVLAIVAGASLGACGSDADSPPGSCGNGVVEGGEVCDGPALNGATCGSITMGALSSGSPGCNPDCKGFNMGTCSGGGGGGPGSGGGPGTGTGGGP